MINKLLEKLFSKRQLIETIETKYVYKEQVKRS